MSAPPVRPSNASRLSPVPAPGNAYRSEPVWREATRWHRRDIAEATLRWLLDPASLTKRIQSACRGRFRVQVLEQGWFRPQQNEMQVLGIRNHSWAFVREVQLLCDEHPWVFARTVIPRTTLTGPRRRLTRLKSRPLGAVLFADPTMERGPVEIARLTPVDRLYPQVVHDLPAPPAVIWGRRSVFTLAGHPLLVSEIFLPGIPACP